ncbi:MAG: M16 family metallopeptidase [Thermoanaerobaculia bacterium]
MKRIASMLLVALAAAPAAVAASGDVTLPQWREVNLKNGAKLLLVEKKDVPMIAVTALLRGGAIADPASKHGLGALTSEMMMKGAGARSAEQIAAVVDSLGANLSIDAETEATLVRADFMAKDAPAMIEIIGDLLQRPTFPESEFEKVRSRAIESIAAAKDSDLRLLNGVYFSAYLYGNHPYGNPVGGTEASLATIAREDVMRFHRDHFGGDRMIAAVVGDFDAKQMESLLRKAFGDWPKAAVNAPVAPPVAKATGRRVLLVDKPDATQTYFWIGNTGTSRRTPERVAVDVANTYFGGRFTSLINTALRIKSGLTYGARSVMVRESRPGPLAIASYTRTDATEKAVDMALEVLNGFRTTGVDDTALASVKAYVLGQFPPDLESNGQLASRIAEIEFYELGRDEVDAYALNVRNLTSAEVKRAIDATYPASDDLAFVFIGNAGAIRDVAKKYGKVEEIRISDPKFRP